MRGLVGVVVFLAAVAPALKISSAGSLSGGSAPETRFVYIGEELVQYQAPSGFFQAWDFNKQAVGKCNPFPSFPRTTGHMEGVEQLIHFGGQRLLYVDPVSKTFELMACNANVPSAPNAAGTFECTALLNATLSLFPTRLAGDLAFAEPNILIEYDRASGEYTLYEVSQFSLPPDCVAEECPFEVKMLGTDLQLSELCENIGGEPDFRQDEFQVVGVRGHVAVKCKGTSSAVMALPFPSQSGDMLLHKTGTTTTLYHQRFISLGSGMIMGYTPQTVDYRLYQCSETGCTDLFHGNFRAELPCSHDSMEDCVADSACGYCVDAGRCMQGDARGPCGGTCNHWTSSAANLSSVIERVEDVVVDEQQIAYLGERIMLRYVPSQGFVGLHGILDNHPSHGGKCPSLSQEPLYSGKLSLKNMVVSPLDPGSVIFHDPRDGSYHVWKCNLEFLRSDGHAAPCGIVAQGTLKEAMGTHSLVSIGNMTLVLNPRTSKLSMFRRRELSSDDVNDIRSAVFDLEPVYSQRHPELSSHKFLSIGIGNVFELNKGTGEYKVWVVDSSRGTLLGPAAHGFLPPDVSHTVAWMGDDKMLSLSSTDLSYLLLRFDMAQFPRQGPLSFTTIGRGNLQRPMCTYKFCSECTQDPNCGWCASTNKCVPGSRIEPCASEKRCVTYTYGYCSAQPCNREVTKSSCIKNGACGWCDKTEMCVPQKDGSALFGDCAVSVSLD
jgi:hypothetical protein